MTSLSAVYSHLEDFISSDDEQALLSRFAAAIADFGGTGFAVASLPEKTRMIVDHNRGLGGWCDHFVQQQLARTCAVTRQIAVEIRPFLWSDVRRSVSDPAQLRVFQAAEAFALTEGLIIPVRTRRGFKGDVFIKIARELMTPTIQGALAAVALTFQSRLELIHTAASPTAIDVTQRERDILSWFAAGKSADDVGQILGVSMATVMFHYRNIAQRYRTLSRTHTVVEAIRRGVICL